jgi:hypothetical protein
MGDPDRFTIVDALQRLRVKLPESKSKKQTDTEIIDRASDGRVAVLLWNALAPSGQCPTIGSVSPRSIHRRWNYFFERVAIQHGIEVPVDRRDSIFCGDDDVAKSVIAKIMRFSKLPAPLPNPGPEPVPAPRPVASTNMDAEANPSSANDSFTVKRGNGHAPLRKAPAPSTRQHDDPSTAERNENSPSPTKGKWYDGAPDLYVPPPDRAMKLVSSVAVGPDVTISNEFDGLEIIIKHLEDRKAQRIAKERSAKRANVKARNLASSVAVSSPSPKPGPPTEVTGSRSLPPLQRAPDLSGKTSGQRVGVSTVTTPPPAVLAATGPSHTLSPIRRAASMADFSTPTRANPVPVPIVRRSGPTPATEPRALKIDRNVGAGVKKKPKSTVRIAPFDEIAEARRQKARRLLAEFQTRPQPPPNEQDEARAKPVPEKKALPNPHYAKGSGRLLLPGQEESEHSTTDAESTASRTVTQLDETNSFGEAEEEEEGEEENDDDGEAEEEEEEEGEQLQQEEGNVSGAVESSRVDNTQEADTRSVADDVSARGIQTRQTSSHMNTPIRTPIEQPGATSTIQETPGGGHIQIVIHSGGGGFRKIPQCVQIVQAFCRGRLTYERTTYQMTRKPNAIFLACYFRMRFHWWARRHAPPAYERFPSDPLTDCLRCTPILKSVEEYIIAKHDIPWQVKEKYRKILCPRCEALLTPLILKTQTCNIYRHDPVAERTMTKVQAAMRWQLALAALDHQIHVHHLAYAHRIERDPRQMEVLSWVQLRFFYKCWQKAQVRSLGMAPSVGTCRRCGPIVQQLQEATKGKPIGAVRVEAYLKILCSRCSPVVREAIRRSNVERCLDWLYEATRAYSVLIKNLKHRWEKRKKQTRCKYWPGCSCRRCPPIIDALGQRLQHSMTEAVVMKFTPLLCPNCRIWTICAFSHVRAYTAVHKMFRISLAKIAVGKWLGRPPRSREEYLFVGQHFTVWPVEDLNLKICDRDLPILEALELQMFSSYTGALSDSTLRAFERLLCPQCFMQVRPRADHAAKRFHRIRFVQNRYRWKVWYRGWLGRKAMRSFVETECGRCAPIKMALQERVRANPNLPLTIGLKYQKCMCSKCSLLTVEVLKTFEHKRRSVTMLQQAFRFVLVKRLLPRRRVLVSKGQCPRCWPIVDSYHRHLALTLPAQNPKAVVDVHAKKMNYPRRGQVLERHMVLCCERCKCLLETLATAANREDLPPLAFDVFDQFRTRDEAGRLVRPRHPILIDSDDMVLKNVTIVQSYLRGYVARALAHKYSSIFYREADSESEVSETASDVDPDEDTTMQRLNHFKHATRITLGELLDTIRIIDGLRREVIALGDPERYRPEDEAIAAKKSAMIVQLKEALAEGFRKKKMESNISDSYQLVLAKKGAVETKAILEQFFTNLVAESDKPKGNVELVQAILGHEQLHSFFLPLTKGIDEAYSFAPGNDQLKRLDPTAAATFRFDLLNGAAQDGSLAYVAEFLQRWPRPNPGSAAWLDFLTNVTYSTESVEMMLLILDNAALLNLGISTPSVDSSDKNANDESEREAPQTGGKAGTNTVGGTLTPSTAKALKTLWNEFFCEVCSEKRLNPAMNTSRRLELVRRMLEQGEAGTTPKVDLGFEASDGQTAFTRAASEGDVDVLELLEPYIKNLPLKDGINRVLSSNKSTALIQAVLRNQGAAVKLLLSMEGIDVDYKGPEGRAVRIAEMLQRDEEMLSALKAKANPSLTSNEPEPEADSEIEPQNNEAEAAKRPAAAEEETPAKDAETSKSEDLGGQPVVPKPQEEGTAGPDPTPTEPTTQVEANSPSEVTGTSTTDGGATERPTAGDEPAPQEEQNESSLEAKSADLAPAADTAPAE